jgi:protein involved in polysaccharide export with SLBB domain
MIRTYILAVSIAFLFVPALVRAQGGLNLQTYVLQPDDLIDISVPNHQDIKYQGPVPPGGRISLPEIGIVTLAGKTCLQLEAELLKKVSEFRNNVAVNVILVEARSKEVQIIGATLKAQGKFTMRPGWRMFDLVAAAGGISAKPNKVSAKLIRGGKAIQLNYQVANDKPDSDDNVLLQPGDMILLDELDQVHQFVSITGEVAKRGTVELDPDLDLNRLVLIGQLTEFSSLKKAHVLRGTEEIPINLESLANAKPDEKVTNFKLRNGDTLFIPRNEATFSVLGVVEHRGVFPLPEGRPVTVLDAYKLAGGSGPTADLAKAGILRTVDKKSSIIPININKILKKAEVDLDIPLKDGDILFIPQRGSGGFRLENLATPFYMLRLLGL